MKLHLVALLAVGMLVGAAAGAATPAERGLLLYRQQGRDWSCASCHTPDPRQTGRHAITRKAIAPMAPAVNPQRLAKPEKVEKWFKRNCKDVFARECTVQEKADFIAYLRSIKP